MSDSILDHPQFDQIAHAFELREGLPLGLLKAVAQQESGGKSDALNPTDGGRGLMQFTNPGVIQKYNVDPSNPWDSLRAGAEYLGDNMKKYGNVNAALADFNGGPAAANAVLSGQAHGPATEKYVPQVNNRLAKTAPSTDATMSAIERHVTDMKVQGLSDLAITQSLTKSPVGDAVQAAASQGMSPADIVTKMGGESLAALNAAKAKVGAQGFGTNLAQGASNAVGDMALGAKQMFTNDPTQTAALQAQAKADASDPERIALGNTVGGTVGSVATKSAPAIAAGLLTGGSAVPLIAGQAAAGALSGALEPTTEDGQRTTNVVKDAAIGGGAAGVGGLVAKTLMRGATVPAEEAARRSALVADGKANGLPVSAANVSPFWKNIAESMPENGSVRAMHANADTALAQKIGEGLGVSDATTIDSSLLNRARPQIQQALDDATNVQVTLPKTLAQDLQPILAQTQNPLTQGIATNSTVTQAVKNLTDAAATGAPVAGRDLQMLASELKTLIQNPAASHVEKQAAGQLVGKINTTLTDAMTPEQATAFSAANKQYANLKAVEKMVLSSGDSGAVSPRQILNAVKNGRFKSAFLQGEAPFQDLGQTASDLYGPANGNGLASIVGKQLGAHSEGLLPAAVIEPTIGIPTYLAKKVAGALLGKAATSTNPTVVRLLSGTGRGLDPVVKAYIAKALGTTSSAAAVGS